MATSQNNQNNNAGGRPTGATGGGHQRNTCRNYQQPGHPPQYMFVDLPGALCPHCQTRHPAEADGIYHAAKQVQDDVVCYQGAFTWPISSSQHWKPSLLYTSQCGVFNLE
ncbi:predicted protein [Plenodomus lingam JN3]|uniref:Predicted protein n=1 Tax=Leptosphaeria maculans (strain JN3 / isolate v23.1.3 / race Av1-4-5-6-7-8) TaxID=985895 RepID=E4ZNP7_LEPMJ|nr:predicted protein [Plenodomus lingam JN3]CBX93266.1 predicted protein [Plenodomus lingam JN3]